MKIPSQGFQPFAPICLFISKPFSNPTGLCWSARLRFPGAAIAVLVLPPKRLSFLPGSRDTSSRKPTLSRKDNASLYSPWLLLVFGLYFTCFPGLSPLFLPLSTRWQVHRSRKASGCITWACDTLLLVLVQETALGSDGGLGELQAVMYPFHPSCSLSRKQRESHPVPQAFLKCGCNSAAPALPGSLLEIQIFFCLSTGPLNQKGWGWAQHLGCNKPSRRFWRSSTAWEPSQGPNED